MAIPYIVRRKADVSSGERKELWYAVGKKLQKKGGKTERDVAHQVAQRTGFHRGVVEAVLTATGEIIEEALSDGHSVTLRGIGSFQTAVTSKGFEHPEDVLPVKRAGCHRIPFKYYFPKELLTKKMEQADKEAEKEENGFNE